MTSSVRRVPIVPGAVRAGALLCLALAIVVPAAGGPRRNLPLSGWDSGVVERARAGASRRLLEPECHAMLDEFKDRQGTSLRENLDRTGLTPGEYLQQIPFYDGSGLRACRAETVLMVASPGLATVFVCPAGSVSRLAREALRHPSGAEFAVIHEMLHTLGLGEDPPTSEQITRRVARRCGRPPR